jgi:hypothetical protein
VTNLCVLGRAGTGCELVQLGGELHVFGVERMPETDTREADACRENPCMSREALKDRAGVETEEDERLAHPIEAGTSHYCRHHLVHWQ